MRLCQSNSTKTMFYRMTNLHFAEDRFDGTGGVSHVAPRPWRGSLPA